MASNKAGNQGSRDDMIIGLLNQLGERLLASEAERKNVRLTLEEACKTIESLEDRTDNGEKIFLSLQQKINKQDALEATLQKRQEALEAWQLEQTEKIEKAAALAERIEEAIAQQARLHRRLEKITQDKVRFIRKLENIEATVTETRAALQSTALVSVDGKPAIPANTPASADDSSDRAPLVRPSAIAAVAAALLLMAGAGWSWMQVRPDPADTLHMVTAQAQKAHPAVPSFEQIPPIHRVEARPETVIEPAILDEADNVAAVDAENAEIAHVAATDEDTLPDALAMSDAERVALFESAPDTLAAALNAIETAALPPQSAQVNEAGNEPVADTSMTMNASPLEDLPAQDFDEAAFIASQTLQGPLAQRIERDKKLPALIADVEQQAFAGLAEAQHDLAAIYTAGHGGIEIDYARAAQWFREAAIGGIANARYNLGVLYHQGLGVPRDLVQAIGWYRAAAHLDHPEAQYNLGIAHIEGIGTPYDPQMAASYFRSAARKDILEAVYNLGLIFENGLLGAANYEEALYWYKKAADQGSPEATAAMRQLARTLNMGEADIKRIYQTTKNREDAAIGRLNRTSGDSAAQAIPEIPAASASRSPEARRSLSLSQPVSSAASSNSNGTVVAIQEKLIRIGLYPGPADGINGPQTEDAIRTYQSMFNLSRDGRASDALLLHMRSNDALRTVNAAGTLRPDDFEIPEYGSRE